ncbi:MAG: response regulator [Calditrichaeota bacterium]|nr:response regulator [Calditrichota bacterium]
MSDSLNVIVIDDDESISNLLSEILRLWNHEVIVLHDSKEAYQLIKERNFDIIFTDVLMPNYNGLELMEKVAEDKPELKDRFVFMTGLSSDHNIELENLLVMEKPFKIREVKEIMDKVSERINRK